MRFTILYLPALLLLGVNGATAPCSSFQAVEKIIADAQRDKKTDLTALPGETGLCSLLVSCHTGASKTVELISAYGRVHKISDTLLFCAFRNPTLREDRSFFAALYQAWKRANDPPLRSINEYRMRSDAAKVDTLCMIIDREEQLNAYALLQWMDAKHVLDDYNPVPRLVCRIIAERVALTDLALNQFEIILEELEPSVCDTLLKNFRQCLHDEAPHADTAALHSWIIHKYAQKGMFGRQIETLLDMEKSPRLRCEKLCLVTQDLIDQRLYREAEFAARAALKHAQSDKERRNVARLLFRSFINRNRLDSAVVWLERTDPESDRDIMDAVIVYQGTGKHEKAARLIGSMPESLSRDTLRLRHLLLTDSGAAALTFVADERTRLGRMKPVRRLWHIRVTLYCAPQDQCLTLLDSMKVGPSDPFATEIMDIRFWLMLLADNPEALAKFRQIEYTLFKGGYDNASKLLRDAAMERRIAWRLAVRIAGRQIEASLPSLAVATLRSVEADDEPGYLYELANALWLSGDNRTAKELLERLLLEFPADIHTGRARILLSRLPGQ